MVEIVLGPPGTGKTTTLLNVVDEELARGTPPDRIGFVTFTRRGAEEAVGRASARFGLAKKSLPWFRTLHSLCFKQLGLTRGDVFEGRRVQEFADHVGIEVSPKWKETDEGMLASYGSGDRILFLENLSRVRMRPLRESYDEDDDGLPWNEVNQVARTLTTFKRNRSLLDFTDMLDVFVQRGEPIGLEVLIVDEAQDLSALQWEVVRVLSQGCRRVVVGGDDDQCIYRWAGADVDRMINLEGDSRVLGQSWRVPSAVQWIALDVVSRIRSRRPKEWAPRVGALGEVLREVDFGDVDMSGGWVAGSEVQPILVLARNNYVIDHRVTADLREAGIVYERHGAPSITPGTLELITSWERLRRGGSVHVGVAREMYELMTAGRGYARGNKKLEHWKTDVEVGLDDLVEHGGLSTKEPWHAALDRIPRDDVDYIRTALQRGEDIRGRPRVRLSTIHGAKGGEAHHVVLMKEMVARTHRELEENPDDECRVWYVAATRARERLTIVDSATNLDCPWL